MSGPETGSLCKHLQRGGAALAVALMLCGTAQAEVLFRCGPSKGYSWYLRNDVSPSPGKWLEDGISKGEIILFKDADGFDIWMTDTVGSRSLKRGGGNIVVIRDKPGDVTLFVGFADTMETYHFDRLSNGGEVVWSQQKFNGRLNKVSAFRASCSGKPEP